MPVADTARLVASLELDDSKFGPAVSRSIGSMGKLETQAEKVRVAQDKLKIANLRLAEAQAKPNLAASQLFASQSKVATATRGLQRETALLQSVTSQSGPSVGKLAGHFNVAGNAALGFSTRLGVAGTRVRGFVSGPLALLAGGAGLLGFVSVVKSAFDSLNRLESVQAQTAAAIKSTGGSAHVTATQIRDLSDALEDKTTIDDKEIQAAANLLLTFTNVRNEAGKGNDVFNQSVGVLTDLATAMHTDASAGAIQLGKALNDPLKGITALTRIGVTFDASQTKRIAAFVKEGNVIGAQKIILAELNKEFGGSGAAAANTYAGQQRRLVDSVEDAKIALAQGLLPGLQNVTKALATTFRNPAVAQGARQLGDTISGLLSPANIESALHLAGAVGDVFGNAGKAFAALPEPVRELLVGGFVVGKASKLVLGVNVVSTGLEAALKAGIGGLAGSLFQRGGTPANPLFVADVAGGLAGAEGAAAGGISKVGGAAGILKATIVGAVVVAGLDVALQAIGGFLDKNNALAAQGLTPAEIQALKYSQSSPADQQQAAKHGFGPGPDYQKDLASALAKVGGSITDLDHSFSRDTDKLEGATFKSADKIASQVLGLKTPLDVLHVDFAKNIAAVKASKDPKKDAAAIAAAIKDLGKGVGSVKTTEGVLGELRRLRTIAVTNGDKADVRILDRDIKVATDKLNFRRQIDAQLHKADAIVHSTESTKNKIRDLEAVEKAIGGRSHAATARVEAAIKRLKLQTNTNVVVNVSSHFNPSTGKVDTTTTTKSGSTTTSGGPTRNAAGGTVVPNGYSLVGEEGPELVRWKQAGTVIPNGDSMAILRNYLRDLVERTVQIPRGYREHRPILQASFGPVEAFVSTANIKRKTTRVRRFGEQFA